MYTKPEVVPRTIDISDDVYRNKSVVFKIGSCVVGVRMSQPSIILL